jgi:hypothetical protein
MVAVGKISTLKYIEMYLSYNPLIVWQYCQLLSVENVPYYFK